VYVSPTVASLFRGGDIGDNTQPGDPAMSAEPAILTRRWRVGRRTCTLSVPKPEPGEVLHVCIEWDPDVPTAKLNAAERRQYRDGRDAAVAELAQLIGGTVAVVEV